MILENFLFVFVFARLEPRMENTLELREKWNKPIFVVQSGINKIIKKFFFLFSLLD